MESRFKTTWVLSVLAVVCAVGAGLWPAATEAQRYGGRRTWAFNSIRPTQGPWGTVVKLEGYGFTKALKVYYNGKVVKPRAIGRTFIKVVVPKGARSGWFEVSHHGRTLRAPDKFMVSNQPKVLALKPTTGPVNIWITVKGEFMREPMRFFIGGFPVKRRFVSEQTIKIFIHRGLRGGKLTYRHKGRKHWTRLRFTLTKFPVITGVSAKRGWQGDTITIRGGNFCPNAKVKLGAKYLPVVSRGGMNSLRVRIPKGASTGKIYVLCYNRRFGAPGRFVLSPPYATITGITPRSGRGNRWVTVEGNGFTTAMRFWLGRYALTRKRLISSSQYQIFIPAGVPSGVLHYESFGKRFASAVSYTVYVKPVLSRVVPSTGWYGDEVTLMGRHFCPEVKVMLGPKVITDVRRESDRKVVVTVPRGSRAGTFSVRCLRWKVRSRQTFKLVPPKAGIRSVQPVSGPPGTKLTVLGYRLNRTDSFYLNNVLMPMRYHSPKKVTLVVPQGAKSGKIFHLSYGRKNATRFRFRVAWPRPIVASFSPRTAWYDDVVTLKGRRICASPKVLLGRTKLAVEESTQEEIRVRLPQKVTTGNLVVKCPGHRVTIRPALRIKPPFAQVFSSHPKSGPWGTWITLTGQNFKRTDRFFVGAVSLKLDYLSEHQVRVLVPSGAKTGKIIVWSGRRRIVTKKRFAVVFLAPVVRDFSPRSGWYGQNITLKGRHFCIGARVFFARNRQARVVKRYSHTALEVKVPHRSITGAVQVICYGKTGQSSRLFVIAPPLAHVSNVSPDRGPWGVWITATGRNFDRKTKFYLGSTRLKVDFKSSTKVRLFIPEGARSGLIYVSSFGRKKDTSFSYVVRKKRKPRPRR